MEETNQFFGLENALRKSLKPVNPTPEFIHHFESRLENYPSVAMETRIGLKMYLFTLLSLVSTFIAAWLFWRLFFQRKA